MNNVYSPTQLEFLKKLAAADVIQPSRCDVRAWPDWMPKDAAMIGSDGWLWDTNQNAAGNLSGYGGMAGSVLGSTAGAVAGSAAAPGIGTIGGGVAGGVAGGTAGRGLGYVLGSGIDWLMGNKPGENQKGFLQSTFSPGAMLGDGAFGLLPGVGKGLQFAARGLTNAGAKAALRNFGARIMPKASQSALARYAESGLARHGGSWGVAKMLAGRERNEAMKRLGMQAYKAPAGTTGLQQIPGRIMNFGQNMGRALATNTGRQALGRQAAGLAAVGIPMSMAGSALGNGDGETANPAVSRPFANTQGYTQVVGNKNRGFSGVQSMG